MRNIFLSVMVLLVTQVSMAQNSFQEDVIKVIKASGSAAQMEVAKDQMKSMISEAKFEEFSKDFDASLPSLYEKIAKVYMETYTHDDVKTMLKFYSTPVGLKISQNAGELVKKSMEAGKEWGVELQGIMMKYME
ncbi:MAG TPA: hypothetical protein DDZ41_07065 [Flavobacterium sp.]|nr:hypothetical protein [Flavobacterium sp.]